MRLQFHNGQVYHPASVYHPIYGNGGLGDDDEESTSQKAAQGLATGFTVGLHTALTTNSKLAGGVAGALAMAAPFTGPAAPFLLLAASLVGPIFSMFKGCGDTCTKATEYANQAATAVQQIKDAYFAQPVRTKASQTAALFALDQVFQTMYTACSNPTLGAAGQRCISERLVRGGTAPWCPTGTGCDMYTSYYDPIANDTGVVADPVGTGVTVNAQGQVINADGSLATTTTTDSTLPLLLGGGALLLLLAVNS